MTLISVSRVSCQCWFLFEYLFSLTNAIKLPFLALHIFYILLVGCSNLHEFLLILLLNVWAKYEDVLRQMTFKYFSHLASLPVVQQMWFPANRAVRSTHQVNFSYEDSGKKASGYLPEFLNNHKIFIKIAHSIRIWYMSA